MTLTIDGQTVRIHPTIEKMFLLLVEQQADIVALGHGSVQIDYSPMEWEIKVGRVTARRRRKTRELESTEGGHGIR